MKSLCLLSSFALATILAAPALARDELPPNALPVTYVVHKLVGDGLDLRGLEKEHGTYQARIAAGDGTIITVGVDPLTADLTDAFSHARVRPAKGSAPTVNASEAVMASAATGYWDVSEISYRQGRWEVEARDDHGRERDVTVDEHTGLVW